MPQNPLVARSPLTGSWYVVTRYKAHPGGTVEALEKVAVAESSQDELERMFVAADAQPTLRPGIALMAAERERQVTQEGWTPDHDAQHSDGELQIAAWAYLTESGAFAGEGRCGDEPPEAWPWAPHFWKPSDHVRNLVKAGALIAAEIDRLVVAGGDSS